MTRLDDYKERYPWIRWEEPLAVKVSGKGQRWACRICVAASGLKASEFEELHATRAAAARHLVEAHL